MAATAHPIPPRSVRARPRRVSHYLAPVAVLIVAGAIALLAVGVATHSQTPPRPPATHHGIVRRLPPFWRVRPGDTLDLVAQKTGLTISQLEAFNPNANPDALYPGERLNLWRHPPVRRSKPPGPRFWLVRPGQSFGSIAADTRIDITRLEELNPQLKPSTLAPGDRVRLRG